jgi:hypothetical protein
MPFHARSAVRFLLTSTLVVLTVAAPGWAQAPWHMTLGPEDSVDIGRLHNAPNGHISYREGKGGLTLWVDGRLGDATQGTFILNPASWNVPDLERATPVKVYEAVHDPNLPCTSDSGWDRNYAAINAVIPGPREGELFAFVDGEFHPKDTGTPLRASIGVATSTDGGITWGQRALIIQGNDMVAAHFDCVAVDARMTSKQDDVGAAGPSVVLRTEGNRQYLYLYYFDRVRFSGGGSPTSDIYVARALYSGVGAPGTWQFWTGHTWSDPGREVVATPVILTPPRGGESAHPQVTYNSVLKRWLMIFHTRTDLYASTSEDGTKWTAPQPLGASIPGARAPAFPTLVTPGSADQQTTGATGWLFYSREVDLSPKGGRKAYLGFRRSFTIGAELGRKRTAAGRRAG